MDYRRSETFDFNYPSWLEKNNTEQVDFHLNRLYTEYGDGLFEVEFKKSFCSHFHSRLLICRFVFANSLEGKRVDCSWP